jgi:hypothetical protein
VTTITAPTNTAKKNAVAIYCTSCRAILFIRIYLARLNVIIYLSESVIYKNTQTFEVWAFVLLAAAAAVFGTGAGLGTWVAVLAAARADLLVLGHCRAPP